MRVLVIGAHCDDIELGLGATVHKHKNDWDITCAVLSTSIPSRINYGRKVIELQEDCNRALHHLGVKDVRFTHFPNAEFSAHRQEIWEQLHKVKTDVNPELVITQHPDEHQDHVVVFENTVRVFKTCSVLTYSLARSSPKCVINYYESVSVDSMNAKLKACREYSEYQQRTYFKPENIKAMARFLGTYIDAEFAEGFCVERIVQ